MPKVIQKDKEQKSKLRSWTPVMQVQTNVVLAWISFVPARQVQVRRCIGVRWRPQVTQYAQQQTPLSAGRLWKKLESLFPLLLLANGLWDSSVRKLQSFPQLTSASPDHNPTTD